MKNNIRKLKIRWRCRRQVSLIAMILINSLILAIIFESRFAQYTELDTWISSCIYSTGIYLLISITIYLIIFVKSKKRVYYINLNTNMCIKNNKEFHYTDFKYTQTIIQIIFDIVDIELYNNKTCKSIKLKDVSKDVLNYLET